MQLLRRDAVATALVAIAGLLYALWAVDSAPWGLSGIRSTGTVILGLGFLASASAVVPGFDQLIRGNKVYLAITSLIGLAAFAGGLWMLINASEAGLALLVGTMGVLWLISTVHHSLLAGAESRKANGELAARHLGPSQSPGIQHKEAA
jgi:hypothetical protein